MVPRALPLDPPGEEPLVEEEEEGQVHCGEREGEESVGYMEGGSLLHERDDGLYGSRSYYFLHGLLFPFPIPIPTNHDCLWRP